MKTLRFAMLGTGFWARFQLGGWSELPGVHCVALYNRTRVKAEKLAAEFGVPAVYDDAEELLKRERVDFVDIVTDVGTHPQMVRLAAAHRLPVICQKPMAPTLAEAERMLADCRQAGVPLFIHENWRWQAPIRELARVLASGAIGTPFRARLDFITGFPVFENQPFLKELDQLILSDLGSHILDVARKMFGEAESLHCATARVHPDIRGEDAATVMMRMNRGRTIVTCNMAYAGTPVERECFPQTLAFIEGDRGSLELAPDFWLRLTTRDGVRAWRQPPRKYAWANPDYGVVHASIVDCNADLLAGLRGERAAETTGEDNLETARLVFRAYAAAGAEAGRADAKQS